MFAPERFGFDTVVVPHFVMIIILFVAIYVSIPQAIVYSIFAGLLYDVVYTDLIGVYMFSMAVTTYVIALCAKVIHTNVIVGLLFVLIAETMLDFMIYGIYTLVGIVNMPVNVFLFERLFPSFILNGVFFILLYFPMRRLTDQLKEMET